MQTPRLNLDAIGPLDRATVLNLQTDPANFAYDEPNSYAEAQNQYERWARHWEEHGWGYWLVHVAATGELIGIGGLSSSEVHGEPAINLYYRLRPGARGKGYASELVGAAVEVAERFGPDLPLLIITDPDNVASIALARKLGFHEYLLGEHRGRPSRFFRRLTTRTKRLVLREPQDHDLPAVLAVEGDPRTCEHRASGPWTEERARESLTMWRADWREHGIGYWNIVLAGTGETIGFGGVRHADLDGEPTLNLYYRLTPAMWGNGYAAEMAEAAQKVARRIGLPMVVITATENKAAIRVAEKLGLKEFRRGDHRGTPSRFYR